MESFEWDILNPDRRLKARGKRALFYQEIKKKSRLSINLDIHHSKVFSSGFLSQIGKVLVFLRRLSFFINFFSEKIYSIRKFPNLLSKTAKLESA